MLSKLVRNTFIATALTLPMLPIAGQRTLANEGVIS
jgi:hypothetical protein